MSIEWMRTERMKLWIQAAEMSFLQRVRSSDIWAAHYSTLNLGISRVYKEWSKKESSSWDFLFCLFVLINERKRKSQAFTLIYNSICKVLEQSIHRRPLWSAKVQTEKEIPSKIRLIIWKDWHEKLLTEALQKTLHLHNPIMEL